MLKFADDKIFCVYNYYRLGLHRFNNSMNIYGIYFLAMKG
jgi:hypothetical protein